MNKSVALLFSIALVIVFLSVDLYGESGGEWWPAWRGPDATGAAKNSNPPVEWSETENIKWKVKVPGESLS